MANVLNKIDVQEMPSSTTPDIWSDFRLIERITVELTQSYAYTLGKYSRFFIELENQKFFGTRCSACKKVYTPPRPLCPDCLKITEWWQLPGTGTVRTFSVLHFSPGSNADVEILATPYALAYVQLDGADTLFPHLLMTAPEQVSIGQRVCVAYRDTPVHHPIHLMYFKPLEV